MRHVSLVLVMAVLAAVPVSAQEEAGQFRTAVSVVGGLSVGSSPSFASGRPGIGGGGHGGDAGFAVGGGLAHDFSPRFTVEATGLYLDRGVSAWSADAGLRLNLAPSRASIVPYFAVSGGLYGQRFETGTRDGNGNRSDVRDARGAQFGRGQPGRPGVGGAAFDRGDLTTTRGTSTDGLLTLGGGVRFAAGPHVFVRPDVRAQVVFSGDNRVLGLFTLNFGYRF